MACRLHGSILYLPCNFRVEDSLGLILFLEFHSEVRVMSCIALNTNSPALLCHSKNKCPSFLGIKVGIGEDQQALILFKGDILL